jgi:hypothetical protein
MDFFKKYHKWLSIILTFFIVLISISGIILNHRTELSGVDISRNILAEKYQYRNWNNAAVKSSIKINRDSILLYGNVGIWLTDSSFSYISDFNRGFRNGIDNKKIYKIYKTKNNKLLAGTLFGLYIYNYDDKVWVKNNFTDNSIMDISQKQDTILLLTRSFLYKTTDFKTFEKCIIPAPKGYDNKIGLFKTLWVIHSGEIYGKLGIFFTDFIGLVFIFLSVTGILYWLMPKYVKKSLTKNKKIKRKMKVSRFSLKWHNKLGWTLIIFLLISTITGMFLRPPFLIPIANKQVNKIPHTELDTDNAWFDKLRRLIYDNENDRFIFATIDGLFTSNSSLSDSLLSVDKQPPISVMGINVFKQINQHLFLIGSFEGLFLYDESTNYIFDYIEKREYIPRKSRIPIGRHMVTGYSTDFFDNEYFFDFDKGVIPIKNNTPFIDMPKNIKNQPISLWNVALEFHTMRIWNSVIGNFYILLIPLIGLSMIFILISGFIVWYKVHR